MLRPVTSTAPIVGPLVMTRVDVTVVVGSNGLGTSVLWAFTWPQVGLGLAVPVALGDGMSVGVRVIVDVAVGVRVMVLVGTRVAVGQFTPLIRSPQPRRVPRSGLPVSSISSVQVPVACSPASGPSRPDG